MNFQHKRIKRFELSGELYSDKHLPKMKDEYARLLEDKMRSSGYVVRLDIMPDWTVQYNGKHYEFILSIYGAYVGKRAAKCIEALDKNEAIYTQKNKSEESLEQQEYELKEK